MFLWRSIENYPQISIKKPPIKVSIPVFLCFIKIFMIFFFRISKLWAMIYMQPTSVRREDTGELKISCYKPVEFYTNQVVVFLS